MTVTADSRHLTASMVVLDPDRAHVLLIFHRAAGLWQFPGGHVDDGEHPADAALREVFEEAGAKPVLHSGDIFDADDYRAPAKTGRPGKADEPAHTHHDLLYVGTADSALPLAAALDEVALACWVPLGELARMRVRGEVPELAFKAWALVSS